ncbi:MAG: 50S ribosomal protein L7/L12 [Anaerolineaceae bacterium 4572_78]|nr:MAG: 50S ribosomal protein L7/L12 [Anaerolineaceae bacterium 4572_78]
MADLAKIVEDLSSLTLLEAADLTKMLEEKWGVSAAAPTAMMAMPTGGAGTDAVEEEPEQTEFNVVLTGIGPKKIKVIKAVRSLRSDLGLKEAKAVVDEFPSNILEGVSKEEAEAGKEALEAEGAEVEIK